jgi:hypothetical protein
MISRKTFQVMKTIKLDIHVDDIKTLSANKILILSMYDEQGPLWELDLRTGKIINIHTDNDDINNMLIPFTVYHVYTDNNKIYVRIHNNRIIVMTKH